MFPAVCARGGGESPCLLKIRAGVCGQCRAHNLGSTAAKHGKRSAAVPSILPWSALRGGNVRDWLAVLWQHRAPACPWAVALSAQACLQPQASCFLLVGLLSKRVGGQCDTGRENQRPWLCLLKGCGISNFPCHHFVDLFPGFFHMSCEVPGRRPSQLIRWSDH